MGNAYLVFDNKKMAKLLVFFGFLQIHNLNHEEHLYNLVIDIVYHHKQQHY